VVGPRGLWGPGVPAPKTAHFSGGGGFWLCRLRGKAKRASPPWDLWFLALVPHASLDRSALGRSGFLWVLSLLVCWVLSVVARLFGVVSLSVLLSVLPSARHGDTVDRTYWELVALYRAGYPPRAS
jgi:hypothetical protein